MVGVSLPAYVEPLPPLVRLLGQLWALDDDLLRRYWSAIRRAHWSTMAAWRTELLLAPQVVVDGIELLVQERQLTRRVAGKIEEHILAQVNAQGGWK